MAVGAPLFWLIYKPNNSRLQGTLWLLVAVWLLQGITGGLFLLASIKIYGEWPEFTPVGLYAVYLKIGFVIVTLHLSILLLITNKGTVSRTFWLILTVLSVSAIVTAGILRWNM
ncbi:MAG: hypothetical protein ACE5EN_08665 [Nitrospinota bacterium]